MDKTQFVNLYLQLKVFTRFLEILEEERRGKELLRKNKKRDPAAGTRKKYDDMIQQLKDDVNENLKNDVNLETRKQKV